MAFRLKLIPTLFTIPAILIMIGLGTWQLDRMKWKEDLIALLDDRTSASPINLPDHPLNQADHEFMPVFLQGQFDHTQEFILQNRTYEKKAGMHVLTPFVLADGKGAVLVDRGWVPFAAPGQEHRLNNQPEGFLLLNGIIRFSPGQTAFIPENSAGKNQWYYIDLNAIDKLTEVNITTDYYVMAVHTGADGDYPVGGQWKIALPNSHLEYAITWYSLALILLVIFCVYHRKKR